MNDKEKTIKFVNFVKKSKLDKDVTLNYDLYTYFKHIKDTNTNEFNIIDKDLYNKINTNIEKYENFFTDKFNKNITKLNEINDFNNLVKENKFQLNFYTKICENIDKIIKYKNNIKLFIIQLNKFFDIEQCIKDNTNVLEDNKQLCNFRSDITFNDIHKISMETLLLIIESNNKLIKITNENIEIIINEHENIKDKESKDKPENQQLEQQQQQQERELKPEEPKPEESEEREEPKEEEREPKPEEQELKPKPKEEPKEEPIEEPIEEPEEEEAKKQQLKPEEPIEEPEKAIYTKFPFVSNPDSDN